MTKPQPKRARAKGELEKFLRAVERAVGPENVSGGGSRHYKIVVPGQGVVILSASPSCHRAVVNTRKRLEGLGVKF